ncbi:MAG TPA: purine-nucleoside phosphorylase [Pantanalinema sp.]
MTETLIAAPKLPAVDLGAPPELGIVLGSGIVVLEDLEDQIDIPYDRIEGLPEITVAGHAGVLTIGTIPGGARVAIARGRFHLYEGHSVDAATSIVRLYEAMGIRKIILTNAAGGLCGDWLPGDLMLIRDQVSLLDGFQAGMSARTVPSFGATPAYDPEWTAKMAAWGKTQAFNLREGVYAGLLGPNYETPAEILWLQRIGTQAVGMSTVLEAAYASSRGIRVLGISCITNIAVTAEAQAATSHGEVVDVAKMASEAMNLALRAACTLA